MGRPTLTEASLSSSVTTWPSGGRAKAAARALHPVKVPAIGDLTIMFRKQEKRQTEWLFCSFFAKLGQEEEVAQISQHHQGSPTSSYFEKQMHLFRKLRLSWQMHITLELAEIRQSCTLCLNEITHVISRSEKAALRILLKTLPRTIWKPVACRPTHHLRGLIEWGTEMIR